MMLWAHSDIIDQQTGQLTLSMDSFVCASAAIGYRLVTSVHTAQIMKTEIIRNHPVRLR
jgi:hypothetical protein